MKINSPSGKAGADANQVKSNGIPANELQISQLHGAVEPVAFFDGPMSTGVTVSHKGRIFVNFPKWGDDVKYTVAELQDGQSTAYPNESINETNEQDQVAETVHHHGERGGVHRMV